MNYPEFKLLSTLPGRNNCNSWQHWESFLCTCACVHGCMSILDLFCLEPILVPTVDCTFWGVCVSSVGVDSRRIYVYSMCFCDYKGIFHSVMLINLISKSRNMKQELKSRLSTVAGCAPAYFQPIFYFFPPQLFFLYPTVKRFNWGWLCRPICQGF